MIVKYAMLDIDSWISTILPSVLCKENFKYHSLCDYNLEVIDVRRSMMLSSFEIEILYVDGLKLQHHICHSSSYSGDFKC